LPHVALLDISLDDLVLKVRQQLASRWTEVDRLAEALDRDGELKAGVILRAIQTPVAWPQM